MSEVIQLKELKSGQRAVISELAAFDDMRRRLQDIGLIEGTVVECVGKSPLGDPAAYLIRGAVIALRSEDSGQVLVCRLEPEEEKYRAGRKKNVEEEMVSAASSRPQPSASARPQPATASSPLVSRAIAPDTAGGWFEPAGDAMLLEFHETEEQLWG